MYKLYKIWLHFLWILFYNVNLLSAEVFNKIQEKKPKDWDYEFCEYVYKQITNNKVFITYRGIEK